MFLFMRNANTCILLSIYMVDFVVGGLINLLNCLGVVFGSVLVILFFMLDSIGNWSSSYYCYHLSGMLNCSRGKIEKASSEGTKGEGEIDRVQGGAEYNCWCISVATFGRSIWLSISIWFESKFSKFASKHCILPWTHSVSWQRNGWRYWSSDWFQQWTY